MHFYSIENQGHWIIYLFGVHLLNSFSLIILFHSFFTIGTRELEPGVAFQPRDKLNYLHCDQSREISQNLATNDVWANFDTYYLIFIFQN